MACAASGCAGGAVREAAAVAPGGPAADYPMVLGAPFTVGDTTYTPADTLNYDAVGHAVAGSDGGAAITAAHRTLPLPSYAEVTALPTGKTILVRIERRGPLTGPALIELSPGAAAQLGLSSGESVAVRLRRTNPPEAERALLRAGQAAPARMDTPKSLLAVLQRRLDQQGAGPTRPASRPVNAVAAAEPAESAAPAADAAKPAPTATPKPAPANAAAQAGGTWFIQIGAFASKANAQAAAAKTGASVVPAGKLWKVRAGPFATADKARPALAKVKAAGYADAIIQRGG